MISYHIRHITRYTYSSTVIDCSNQLMLYPINDVMQVVKDHKLEISTDPAVEVFTDYFGNRVGVFSVIQPHTGLSIISEIEVIVNPVELPGSSQPAEAEWNELVQVSGNHPYLDFLQKENFLSENDISNLLDKLVDRKKDVLTNVSRLSEYVYKNFAYKKGVTSVETKVDEILKLKAGVCQDFAHVLLVMLRMIGIPARYVSGYICPKNQELRGEGATHAWAETYIPFYGWLGIDPTNNCIVSDRHVRLAVGRNFSDCTPVKGTYKGSSDHTLEVSVVIENGQARSKEEKEKTPVFSYTSKNPGISSNSYLRYLEMQQQQQ